MDHCKCYTCERCDAEISIAQSHKVCYVHLQRILMLLKMEMYRAKKVTKNMGLCLSYRAKVRNVAHFLSEGQIYLNIANILYEHNQKMSTIFIIMLKAMDSYSKLKMHLRGKEFEKWNEGSSLEEEDFDDLDFYILIHEDQGVRFDEILSTDDESEYSVVIDKICFFCVREIYDREFLLEKIELLIELKNLCVEFTESSSALYVVLHLMLRDYCERARLFLHDNTRIMKSRQERSSRDDCYSYHLLEQLLKHVSKAQEYVAGHVDIKLKEESGKFNN